MGFFLEGIIEMLQILSKYRRLYLLFAGFLLILLFVLYRVFFYVPQAGFML